MLPGVHRSIEIRSGSIRLRTAVLFPFAKTTLLLILITGAANKFTPVLLVISAGSLPVEGQEVGSLVQEAEVAAAASVAQEEVMAVEEAVAVEVEEEADEPQDVMAW